jgi:hypothetical protein
MMEIKEVRARIELLTKLRDCYSARVKRCEIGIENLNWALGEGSISDD